MNHACDYCNLIGHIHILTCATETIPQWPDPPFPVLVISITFSAGDGSSLVHETTGSHVVRSVKVYTEYNNLTVFKFFQLYSNKNTKRTYSFVYKRLCILQFEHHGLGSPDLSQQAFDVPSNSLNFIGHAPT